MAEYWTVEQAQANAELLSKEFSNRQILLFGLGQPIANVPIGVEYEDRSFFPAVRYRKVGLNASDWMKLLQIEAASKQDVLQGVNDQKMVTPARLTEKLNQFSSDVMGVPTIQAENVPKTISVLLELQANEQTFKISLPPSLELSLASIILQPVQQLSVLNQIEGGDIGQLINLKRSSLDAIQLNNSDFIKIGDPFLMNDVNLFDNITLQKISSTLWVEVSRKKF